MKRFSSTLVIPIYIKKTTKKFFELKSRYFLFFLCQKHEISRFWDFDLHMKNKTNKKGISIRQSNIILKVGQVAKEKTQ